MTIEIKYDPANGNSSHEAVAGTFAEARTLLDHYEKEAEIQARIERATANLEDAFEETLEHQSD